jgi:hypothetical protein
MANFYADLSITPRNYLCIAFDQRIPREYLQIDQSYQVNYYPEYIDIIPAGSGGKHFPLKTEKRLFISERYFNGATFPVRLTQKPHRLDVELGDGIVRIWHEE